MAVKQTFTGDAKQLTAEIDRMNRKYAQMEQQLASLQEQSEKTNTSGSGGTRDWGDHIDSAVTKIGGMITAYVGVEQVLGRINDALKEREALEQAGVERRGGIAAAQEQLIENVGGAGGQARIEMVQRIAQDPTLRHPDVAGLTRAAISTASLAGSLPISAEESALRAATGISPSDTERLAEIAGASLQVQNALGAGTTAEQAIGMMMSTGQLMAVTSVQEQASMVAPTVFGASTIDPGDSANAARQAAGLLAAFTQVTGPHGAMRAATSAQGMMSRLATFFRQEGREDPGSLFARIQALQASPDLAEEFIGAEGQVPGVTERLQPTARALLTSPDALAFQQAQDFAGRISADAALYQERFEAVQGLTPELVEAGSARTQQAITAELAGIAGQGVRLRAGVQQLELMDPSLLRATLMGAVRTTEMPLRGFERQAGIAMEYGQGVVGRLRAAGIEPSGPGGATITDREQKRIDLAEEQVQLLQQLVRQNGDHGGAENAQADRHTE